MIQLGFRYAHGVISGSNARCLALLGALREFVRDYETPSDRVMSRDLDSKLKPQIQFIKTCRPLSISMGNAIKYFKVQVHNLQPDMPENEAKEFLIEQIDDFIRTRIDLPDKIIAGHGAERISDGDVIMTYSCSSIVEMALKTANAEGKEFSVVVVDSSPRYEGREMLKRLSDAGIKCSYVMLNGASHMMKQVSKVFLGASAMLSNGSLFSRIGTASVAMVAQNYNVPVLVLCETYKFCERVQLDSITHNELGDPDQLVHNQATENMLKEWRTIPSLKLLNLIYDVTPTRFINMVITELGLIPPTSVPVIIREFWKELSM